MMGLFQRSDEGEIMFGNKEILTSCIQEGDGGIYLDINVSPDSSSSEIKDVDRWRDEVEVNVKERPEKGKANRTVILLLADILSLPKNNIKIVKGKVSRRKRIFISNMDKEEFLSILSKNVGEKR